MTRRVGPWLVTAVLFTLVNAVAAGFAMAPGEVLHAGVHFVLMFAGTYATWRLATRTEASSMTSMSAMPGTSDRLDQLQQSVDVVAIELERLGEAQRFNAKLQAERVDARE